MSDTTKQVEEAGEVKISDKELLSLMLEYLGSAQWSALTFETHEYEVDVLNVSAFARRFCDALVAKAIASALQAHEATKRELEEQKQEIEELELETGGVSESDIAASQALLVDQCQQFEAALAKCQRDRDALKDVVVTKDMVEPFLPQEQGYFAATIKHRFVTLATESEFRALASAVIQAALRAELSKGEKENASE